MVLVSLHLVSTLLILSIFIINIFSYDEIIDRMYTSITDASGCIKLLTKNGQYGCNIGRDGLIGILMSIDSDYEFNSLILNPPDYKIALLLPLELYNVTYLSKLAKINIAGVMILNSTYTGNIPLSYSDDISSPLYMYNPQNINFTWNTAGSDRLYQLYNFSILKLSYNESIFIHSKSLYNRNKSENSGLYVIEFNYFMPAHTNSIICLYQSSCSPIGGYSIWSTFHQRIDTYDNNTIIKNTYNNKTRPYVLITTHLDSLNMFHKYDYAADSTISGLVTFLSSIYTLNQAVNKSLIDPKAFKRQLVFAALMGESYGFVGSRKFVKDLNNFICTSYDENGGCSKPYMPDLNFTKLLLSNMDAYIEVNQVGLINDTIFVHTHNAMNNFSSFFLNSQSKLSPEFICADIDCSTQGMPPSSSWSFFNNSNITAPFYVLTDHRSEYTNKYYHSAFDTNLTSAQINNLCNTSIYLARTLVSFALNSSDYSTLSSITLNCSIVTSLYNCLNYGVGCSDFGNYDFSTTLPSYYTNTYIMRTRDSITGISSFVNSLMSNWTAFSVTSVTCSVDSDCQSSYTCSGSGFCIQSSTHYHDAVDPDLYFDYTSYLWRYAPASNSKSLIFTEPYWTYVGTRMYRREDNITPWMVFLGGLFFTSITAIAVHYSMKSFKLTFKI